MSIRKTFEEELWQLKTELVEMCRLTEQMIDDTCKALAENDLVLAASVKPFDRQVDEMELDIERKCMRILLRQQPVAKDFREVSTALKLITDIERIGDQAADIGDLLATQPLEKGIFNVAHLIKMGELAKKMVHDSVNSFIHNDEALASKTAQMDDEIDELFKTVTEELIEIIRNEKESAESAIMTMMVAKYLERIGDHAVNVCEWTGYNETGIRKKYQ